MIAVFCGKLPHEVGGTSILSYPFFRSQNLEIECWLKVHKLLGKGLLGLWLDQSLLLKKQLSDASQEIETVFY